MSDKVSRVLLGFYVLSLSSGIAEVYFIMGSAPVRANLGAVEVGPNVGEIVAERGLRALDAHVVRVHPRGGVGDEEAEVAFFDGGDARELVVLVVGGALGLSELSCMGELSWLSLVS